MHLRLPREGGPEVLHRHAGLGALAVRARVNDVERPVRFVKRRDAAQHVAVGGGKGELVAEHFVVPLIDPPVGVRGVVVAGQVVHVVRRAPVRAAAGGVRRLKDANPLHGIRRHGIARLGAVFGNADLNGRNTQRLLERAVLRVMRRKAVGAFINFGELVPGDDVRQAAVVAAEGHERLHLVRVVVRIPLEVRSADLRLGVHRLDDLIARQKRLVVLRREVPAREPPGVHPAAVRLVEGVVDNPAAVFGGDGVVNLRHDVFQHLVIRGQTPGGRLVVPGVNLVLAIDLQIFPAGGEKRLVDLRDVAHRVLQARLGLGDRGIDANRRQRIFAGHVGLGKAVEEARRLVRHLPGDAARVHRQRLRRVRRARFVKHAVPRRAGAGSDAQNCQKRRNYD